MFVGKSKWKYLWYECVIDDDKVKTVDVLTDRQNQHPIIIRDYLHVTSNLVGFDCVEAIH